MEVDSSNDPTDPRMQLEMFLFKFPDVARPDITKLLDEFKKFDFQDRNQLEENEAMMLLEHRGETKTALELRRMVEEMDYDHNHKLSFLEWCTCHYHKSWVELHTFTNEAARRAAMALIEAAMREQQRVRDEMAAVKRKEEEDAAKRAAELEAEAKLTGVAGMSAFFKRQIEGASDTQMSAEEKIHAEAARRKALREAKAKEASARDQAANAKGSREDAERAIAEEKSRADEEKRREDEQKKSDDDARRKAFKDKQRGQWEKKAST